MTKKAKITKTKATPTKSKRVSLNPQPILDAKTAALKERGVKLTWAGRKWHVGRKTLTSLEMSKYGVEEFAKLFPAKWLQTYSPCSSGSGAFLRVGLQLMRRRLLR